MLRTYIALLVCFFFFQAEDGIRDLTVTGVQTCALPISRRQASRSSITRASGGVKLTARVVISTVPHAALLPAPVPGLTTDERVRAAYSEGAGIYRIVPAGVALPRGVEELQALVRWAAEARTPPGPRSVRCGSVRAWVDAVEIVEADGTARRVTRGAGRWERFVVSPDQRRLVDARFPKTRKNSSGYALDRYAESGDELDLLIGAEGTLALVTAVRWRLEPIPPDVAGASLGFGSLDALAQAVPLLIALNPSAVELLDRTVLELVRGDGLDLPGGIEGLLLVEFERDTRAAARGVVGDAVRGLKTSTVHVATAVDRGGLERLWSVRKLASPALARLPPSRRSLQVVEDGCVPLERLAEYIAGVRAAAERCGLPVALFGHAGDGHVHVNALPDTTVPGGEEALAGLFAAVNELPVKLEGTPSGEHGDGRLRAGLLERFYGSEVMALFRDVKRAYDPRAIFNPGVILPSPEWAPLVDLKVGADAAPIPDDIAARLREIERTAGWATPKLQLARSSHPEPRAPSP